ncbi:MAG: FG-GAP-like repeat-containing protein, partial [Solirubrobacterales bacterium]
SAAFPQTEFYAVGETPTAVAIGDLNHDHSPDLAVTNFGSGTVSVLLGNAASESFSPAQNYPAGLAPTSVTVGYLNADANLDLAIGKNMSGYGTSVEVLLGNGDGSFSAPVSYDTGTDPVSVVIGEFTGDNKPDIASANQFSDSVSILESNGDGTFDAPVNYPVGEYPTSIAAGDLNGDHRDDLVVTNADSDNIAIMLANSSGTFDPATFRAAGHYPVSVAIGMPDGVDNFADLAIADNFDSDVTTMEGNGDGTFGPAIKYPVGGAARSVAIGDLNGDNFNDLAVAFGDGGVAVLNGTQTGGFQEKTTLTVGDRPSDVAIGDVSGDGINDLAASNRNSDNVTVMRNRGPAVVAASPASLVFPDQVLGSQSNVQTVTFTNTESFPVVVNSAVITGPATGDFATVANTCDSGSLAGGGTCEVGLKFGPSATGLRNAALELDFVDGGIPVAVPLSGTGIKPGTDPVPVAKIKKVKVSGPKKAKKGKKATYKVKITNSGGAVATGVRLKVKGRGLSFNTSVSKIKGGTTRTVKVKLKPKKPGKFKASFKVTSKNAGGKTVKKKITVRK